MSSQTRFYANEARKTVETFTVEQIMRLHDLAVELDFAGMDFDCLRDMCLHAIEKKRQAAE